ncbi:MAG: VOC family protein [Acidimicrobiales bacterium]
MAILAGFSLSDPPELWADLGFSVEAGSSRVGGLGFALGAAGSGITDWTLAAAEVRGGIDGLPTRVIDDPATDGAAPEHPNAVVSLDHVVVMTPDLERTVAALGQIGIFERRRRDAGRPGQPPTTQVFFRLGEAILELVGSPEARGEGPARFWGLAFTVSDLERTAAVLGDRLRDVKEAVQPGRRIASLDHAAGSAVPIAFMTADQGR